MAGGAKGNKQKNRGAPWCGRRRALGGGTRFLDLNGGAAAPALSIPKNKKKTTFVRPGRGQAWGKLEKNKKGGKKKTPGAQTRAKKSHKGQGF